MKFLKSLLVPVLGLGLIANAMADRGPGKGFYKTLTKEQKTKLMTMGVAFKKKSLLLKMKKKQAKAELVLLVTANKPNKAVIAKAVTKLLAAKKAYLMAKIDFKIALRKELTPQQRTWFDMKMMKKAMRGKRGCRGYHRGHHRGHHGYGHHGYGRRGKGMPGHHGRHHGMGMNK